MSHNNLFKIVSEMAMCNDFYIRPIEEWPNVSPNFDIDQLELQAAEISHDDFMDFVDGEERVAQEIVKRYGIKELDRFLNAVFDGYLHEVIAL